MKRSNRNPVKVWIARSCACVAIFLGFANCRTLLADGACRTVVVLPDLQYQQFFGFGQGNMHQADPRYFAKYDHGVLEKFLDDLYTVKEGGLGLRICRFNMPGGENPAHRHMSRFPFGTLCPRGFEPKDGIFEWAGHENILWHLFGAKKRGAVTVAFWNSPPWWMTVSGCAAGGADPLANNLRPGMEQRFARHIVDVLLHFRDTWKIDFDAVSPINEPESNYWREGGGQEGCHVDPRQAVLIINALNRELERAGLHTRIQAFEAASSKSLGYLDFLLGDVRSGPAIDTLTCHQYVTTDKSLRKWAMRARMNHKHLWMSEWGDWHHLGASQREQTTQMIAYARKIHGALTVMQAEAWCMWEPGFLFDEKRDGLGRRKSFYAVAQFSRFIRAGMRRVEAAGTATKNVAFVDAKKKRLVVVILNDNTRALDVELDLSRFAGCTLEEARRTSVMENFVNAEKVRPARSPFTLPLPPLSVTSLTFAFKKIRPGLVRNPGFETGELGGDVSSPSGRSTQRKNSWAARFDPPRVSAKDAADARRLRAKIGVQDNYPTGGLYNGFIDPGLGQGGALEQTVDGLDPRARYRLEADCAEWKSDARFGVRLGDQTITTPVRGGGYQRYAVEFSAPPGGSVTIVYQCGPRKSPKDLCWATIDNVSLTRLR